MTENIRVPGTMSPDIIEKVIEIRLAVSHPQCWERTKHIAQKAEKLAVQLNFTQEETVLLLNAAWVVHIGNVVPEGRYYSWDYGNGAMLLMQWDLDPVAALLAWHLPAPMEARMLDLEVLVEMYPRPAETMLDAITYLDSTTSYNGKDMTLAQRLVEIRARHGQGSIPARAFEEAYLELKLAHERVTTLIGH